MKHIKLKIWNVMSSEKSGKIFLKNLSTALYLQIVTIWKLKLFYFSPLRNIDTQIELLTSLEFFQSQNYIINV